MPLMPLRHREAKQNKITVDLWTTARQKVERFKCQGQAQKNQRAQIARNSPRAWLRLWLTTYRIRPATTKPNLQLVDLALLAPICLPPFKQSLNQGIAA